ncbi:MAG TPA: hypothetical protein VFV38_05625, partial [Ktedonobacteraceae bacterium]|nr:hypothetical protein [Ktedonobacteraceae bacterium]
MKGQSHWYDTAQEDQTRPGLRWAKFHKMVGQGLIPRVLLPGMKQGVHPRRDVDTLMFPVNEPVVLPFVRLEPFRVYFESIIMDPALP